MVPADRAAAELVACEIDPQVLLVPHGHQPVVALEAVGVDHSPEVHFAPYRGQNRVFRAIRNHLRVDLALPLADAERDSSTLRT